MNFSKNKKTILGFSLFTGLLVSLASGFQASAETGKSGYQLLHKTLVGGKGGWDIITIDEKSRMLYSSHSDRVEVMDLNKNKIVGTVTGTNGIHGIAVVPEIGHGYTSNGKANTSTVFDLKTLKVLKTIKTGEKPDAIMYDPFSKKVYVFNGNTLNCTVIDPKTDKVVGTIALVGAPEFAVSDEKGNIFVNLEDKSETLKIDTKTLKVTNRWKLGKGEEPSGIALDKKNNILFIACQNKFMIMMNADTGKILDTLPIGDGVDGAAFDDSTNNAFSSNRDGTLTVIHEDSPVKFKVVENVKTMFGSKTLALDPKTHHVFLGAASFGKAPAPTKDKPHPRKPVLPGTFMILEYGIK